MSPFHVHTLRPPSLLLGAALEVFVLSSVSLAAGEPQASAPPERAAPADAPPDIYIYKTFGQRRLVLAPHYPPNWKKEDKRPAALLFSGSHKVQPDKNGKLPPLAEERAKLGLPVVNTGPEGPGAMHKPLAEHFAQIGLVCFRVEYRTRGKDGVLPGADLADAVDAIRWVRRNAATLGIDPDRIVAAGCSSGGYLAAGLFALDSLHPKDEGNPAVSARPNALLLCSPLLDWLRVGTMSENFMVVLGGDKELGEKLSPIRHWRKDMPPTLILVGTEEPMFATVKEFADKWMGEGAPMEIYVAEGGVHGFFGKPDWVERADARMDEFLRKLGYLKDEPRAEAPTPPENGKSGKAAKGAAPVTDVTDMAGKLAAILEKYPDADADRDGVLTKEEMQAYKSKMKQPKQEARGQPPADKGAAPVGAKAHSLLVPSRDWDANKDGRISKDEFKAPAMMFEKFDLDSDGYLAGNELAKLDSKLNMSKTSDCIWSVPPETNYHGVEHKTYFSKAMQTEVGYNIYLPDEYQTSQKRYPVIYHLHGSGGNESSQIDLSEVYQKAIAEHKMCPVIIVFVNGGKHSYYCDGADGKVLAETTIVRELIPHIDGAYRTIPEKACRVIHGFSMGGFGAMRLASKYPDLFCAALSFGGGMASPDSVHLLFLKHILGYDDRLLAENNTADLITKNKAALAGMTFWLFSGTKDVALEDSTWAHNFLQSQGIADRFEVSKDVGHACKKHYAFFGDDIFKMLQTRFAASPAFSKQAAGK